MNEIDTLKQLPTSGNITTDIRSINSFYYQRQLESEKPASDEKDRQCVPNSLAHGGRAAQRTGEYWTLT